MAASSDYTKPTYVDMSHLCPVDATLTGSASMGAGNTVSGEPAIHGAPGTPPANPLPPGIEDDVASLNIGPQTSYVKKVGK
jgi:hypothetical protein